MMQSRLFALCCLFMSASSLLSPSHRRSRARTALFDVAFAKYHGLGNDFILIDNRSQADPSLTSQQSQQLCDRNFGIGGDAGYLVFWRKDKTEYHKLKLPSPVLDLDHHPTKAEVATAHHDGRIRLSKLGA